ncbi:hypothetical protein DL96DRAFT_265090 [Flagelloscypha sp. PMI_526]|nr:hypothetical protein DL96DRAFT_265090 [Flagelloscypha sp. PMI_526]
MHPYNCSCHSDSRPSGKARSGSLSSFTQSSPSSGSSDASSNLYPQPEDLPSQTSAPLGGLSLSAPKPDTPLHIPMSPPVGSSSSPPKERKRTKHKARRPSDSAPLPPSSSGIAQASVNADTAGGTSDAESVVRGQRQLRSRLADLLTDPTNTPSPDASVSFSMPNMAGSYFPPQATAAREYDSLRRKDSSFRRARSPTMPQQSKPGLVQQATAPSRLEQSYDVTHTVSSLPRPGISVASDAARKVLKEKQKTEKQSTASGATTTSGGRQRAYSGEVSYKGSSSSAAWASSTRQGTASPMPIPSGINAGSMRWDGQ